MPPTISVVDDEASIREAVALLLHTHGFDVACYDSAAVFLAAPFAAGCVVSDIRMPETSGLDLLRILQSARDPRPVILLTGHGDVEMAVQAIKIGAQDFIEKPFRNERLLRSVRTALSDSEKSLVEHSEIEALRARYVSLSERQRETLRLLTQGLSNKEIAARLGISPRTVEIHRTWVMNKMAASTIVDLVRMAMALEIS